MNTSTLSSARVAQAGLIVAAFVAVTCAADDLTSPASLANLATHRAAPVNHQCATAASQHTIYLEDGSGRPFQLVYVAGQGWRQIAATSDEGQVVVEKASYPPQNTSQATEPGGDVLAVFIDGPTGYTYTWSSEKGWKFVGHIKGG